MVLKRCPVVVTTKSGDFSSQCYLLYFGAGLQFPPTMDITSHILKKRQSCSELYSKGKEMWKESFYPSGIGALAF